MAEGINVRFAGTLHQFIQEKTSSGGLYNSASEYIRDLVRHDYENSRRARLEDFYDELETTLTAPSGEFVPFDVEKIIRDGKTRRSKADP